MSTPEEEFYSKRLQVRMIDMKPSIFNRFIIIAFVYWIYREVYKYAYSSDGSLAGLRQ